MNLSKLRFLFSEFFQRKKIVFVLFFLSVIFGVLDLVLPFLAQHSLDYVFPSKNLYLLSSFAALVGGFYGIQWAFGLAISFLSSNISLQSSKNVRIRAHQISLENYSENDAKTALETALRIESDAGVMVHFFLKSLEGVGRNATALLAGVILVGFQDLCLLILFIVYSLIQCGVSRLFYKGLCERAANSRKLYASLLEMLRDHLSGKRMIYLLNVQTFFENQFLKMQELRFSLEKKSAMWRRFESFFGTGISFVFKMGIGFYLANSLMTGQLTAGQGAFLVLILPKLHSYFLQLSGVFRDVKMMEDGAVRLFEILKTKEKQELKTVFEFRSLVFKNVFFSRDGKEVIHDLSFEIQRGEKVVFYGPSGCGKTTVWLLMLGLLKPIAGEILLNGEPLETMDLKSWYGLLSIVPQENELFRLSWDDNLRLGRKEKWVWNPDFFPLQGLREETSAVYRGEVATFSKGEMRRLVVARALLNNAPVLLLDEPDAHWDEALADKISRFFFGFSEKTAEKTLFLFTHRPSWIQKAEKRIFLGALV